MPTWGKRGTYAMLNLTMLSLAFVACMVFVCRPLVPPPELGPIAREPGQFMRSGASQKVAWQTLGDDPFAEARRLDLPVLFVIGTDASNEARAYDRWVFSANEVAVRINRDFIPVRVDLDQSPDWAQRFWPLSQARTTLDSGFQIWVTTSEGKVVAGLTEAPEGIRFDPVSFLSLLSRWHQIAQQRELDSQVWATHQADAENLRQIADQEVANRDAYAVALQARLTTEGFAFGPSLRPATQELRLLLEAGPRSLADAAWQATLQSRSVDWVHGGLFEEVEPQTNVISYDKRAETAAEWAALCALRARQTGDAVDHWIAEWTFDRVWNEFHRDGKVLAWVSSEADAFGRNRRNVLEPGTISLLKDPTPWGLSGDNSTFSLRWTPPVGESVLAEREKELNKLREHPNHVAFRGGPTELLGPTATFYARMLEAARLLGDGDRAEPVARQWPRMAAYRAGPGDVRRTSRASGRAALALADYVAYIDFALQVALWDGNRLAMDEAIRVAGAALAFADGEGLPTAGRPDAMMPPAMAPLPAPLDGPGESPTSGLMRTLNVVALALPDSERPSLRNRLRRWSGALGHDLRELDRRTSSFYRADNLLRAPRGVLVVGDPMGFRELLALTSPRVPTLAVDTVPGLRPGVYLVSNDRREGPISAAEALDRLRLPPNAP